MKVIPRLDVSCLYKQTRQASAILHVQNSDVIRAVLRNLESSTPRGKKHTTTTTTTTKQQQTNKPRPFYGPSNNNNNNNNIIINNNNNGIHSSICTECLFVRLLESELLLLPIGQATNTREGGPTRYKLPT